MSKKILVGAILFSLPFLFNFIFTNSGKIVETFSVLHIKDTFNDKHFLEYLKSKWKDLSRSWTKTYEAQKFRYNVISCGIIRDYSEKFIVDPKQAILEEAFGKIMGTAIANKVSLELKLMSPEFYLIENPGDTVYVKHSTKDMYKILNEKLKLKGVDYLWDQINFNTLNQVYLLHNCFQLYSEFESQNSNPKKI